MRKACSSIQFMVNCILARDRIVIPFNIKAEIEKKINIYIYIYIYIEREREEESNENTYKIRKQENKCGSHMIWDTHIKQIIYDL